MTVEPPNSNKHRIRLLIQDVDPKFSLYKRYLSWFHQHEVTTSSRYDQLLESLRLAKEEEARRIREEELEYQR